ncbi:hypothetical protein [Haliea sp.]|uniref:hypothetical protein n=1 Tax=Haliea sp. TaxID=1932666 RepID=UPI000C40204F|nr:hypothetical protein [Haliea sp.]MAD65707.1 hypothetical protein [Haliea sp.]|tara:strand:+ start:40716 stop:41801 length:1086 start_codon:yes stop_codon:yes gene_type:complete
MQLIDQLKIATTKEKIKKWWWFKRFNFSKQVQFVSYLNSWLSSYASENQACDAILEAYDPSSVEYKAALELRRSLSQGRTLADGMRGLFHPNIVSVFSSAERSGDKSLKVILNEFIEFESMKKSLRKSLSQPLKMPLTLTGVLLATTVPISSFLGLVQSRARGDFEYNWSTYLTVGLSEILTTYLPFTIFIVFALSIYFLFYAKTSTSKFRLNFLDQHFPFKLYREFSAIQLLSTVGILVDEGGLTPKQAVMEVHEDSTEYQRHHIEQVIRADGKGQQSLSELFDTGLLNRLTLTRLRILSSVKKESIKKAAVLIAARSMKEDILNQFESFKTASIVVAWLFFGVLMISNAVSIVSILTQF